jgi:hypothetical protein
MAYSIARNNIIVTQTHRHIIKSKEKSETKEYFKMFYYVCCPQIERTYFVCMIIVRCCSVSTVA